MEVSFCGLSDGCRVGDLSAFYGGVAGGKAYRYGRDVEDADGQGAAVYGKLIRKTGMYHAVRAVK